MIITKNVLISDKQLVIVTWFDSSSIAQWSTLNDIKQQTIHENMKSVGWITNETDILIALSANAGNACFGHTTVIPKVNITDIQYLNKGINVQ
jgi:hypothetical protein